MAERKKAVRRQSAGAKNKRSSVRSDSGPAITAAGSKRRIFKEKLTRPFARRKPAVKRTQDGTRMLQVPARYWYNPLSWRHRPPPPPYKPLPKARKLFWTVLKQLWAHRVLFGGIVLIYGVLNLILVRSLSGSSNLATLKSSLDGVFHGVSGRIFGSGISFAYLLATSGSGDTTTSGVYQALLLVVCSLAFVWALRQVIAKRAVRIRDGFYRGMYPVVPFVLVFLLLCLQLVPLAIGGTVYTTILSRGIAVGFWEKALSLLVFLLLGLWSLRMITASVIALYIVMLPEMTPLRAYRSARQLVYGRRLLIWRKLIFLPIVMLLLSAVIMLPLIYFAAPVAQWVFFVISMCSLPVIHGYLYNLYREML